MSFQCKRCTKNVMGIIDERPGRRKLCEECEKEYQRVITSFYDNQNLVIQEED